MIRCVISLSAFALVVAEHAGVTEMAIDADGDATASAWSLLQRLDSSRVEVAAVQTDAGVQAISQSQPAETAKPATIVFSVRAVFAEYVAMVLFVVIGCGSAMAVAKEPSWVLQVALTFGFAITALAYTIGHYSGGHINCAVTLGLVLTGHCGFLQGLLNFFAQVLGSITGAGILRAIFPEAMDKTGGLGSNGVSEGWSQLNALAGEIMMTFLLMFVVLETATNPAAKANSPLACIAIGFAVFLAHSVLIPIDGCSINPTRSLGPALVAKFTYKDADTFGDMWVFWLGPLLGATLAAAVSTALMV